MNTDLNTIAVTLDNGTRNSCPVGTIVKAERLGGLLNFYHRQAA
jgi:hypothetical protein